MLTYEEAQRKLTEELLPELKKIEELISHLNKNIESGKKREMFLSLQSSKESYTKQRQKVQTSIDDILKEFPNLSGVAPQRLSK